MITNNDRLKGYTPIHYFKGYGVSTILYYQKNRFGEVKLAIENNGMLILTDYAGRGIETLVEGNYYNAKILLNKPARYRIERIHHWLYEIVNKTSYHTHQKRVSYMKNHMYKLWTGLRKLHTTDIRIEGVSYE